MVLAPSFWFCQVTNFLKAIQSGKFFMSLLIIVITATLGNTRLYAQQDSTNNTQTDSIPASDGNETMNLPPPPGSCTISGTSPVTAGNTYTYTLSCDNGSGADSWGATCGTVLSWSAN